MNPALLAPTYQPTPLAWTRWPERAGWWQAPIGDNGYEVGNLLINADHSLRYTVIEDRGSPRTLLVGPKAGRP